jgi:hypothetical protein
MGTAKFIEALEKNRKLTKEDLQVIREENGMNIQGGSGLNALQVRMQVETIDAIRSLDETSSFLSKVGIAVAIIGALFTLLQVLIAFKVLPR